MTIAPLFSVVTPHHRLHILTRTLNSLLAKTLVDFKAADDGGVDAEKSTIRHLHDIAGPVKHQFHNNDAKSNGALSFNFLFICRKWTIDNPEVNTKRKNDAQNSGFRFTTRTALTKTPPPC